ncbi:LacI family DNA-binding transcriptional regulator [Schaalia suimastitidis]|uniref:LacI family DNA-binding transcriptional regulator n=1 Tax=Schaalia suimastitidis TaxID=121163 RepID=UPI00047D0D43|nr:LacI family DNA-binding transcriptional regulator [Schaalia suimastitidis]
MNTASRPPSVKDVASHAHVSVGTVSNVINGRGTVRPEIRERVETAIRDLGYVPNPTAQALRRGTSPLVGVAVYDLTNPFFMEAAAGMDRRLTEGGCIMALSATQAEAQAEAQLLRTLAGQAVRGILLSPVDASLKIARELVERGIPVVLFDFPADDTSIPSVAVDDHAGARLALNHLMELGHRRIGFLNGPARIRQARDREAGTREAVLAFNAQRDTDDQVALSVYECEAFTVHASMSLMRQLIDNCARDSMDTLPTAFFCANDLIAIGAVSALRDAGLRVPHDVSIVGFDDIPLAKQMAVPLTTVHQPMDELGWAAADLLLNGDIHASEAASHRRFVPDLVIRASTAAPTL